jgi:hypothetical protein
VTIPFVDKYSIVSGRLGLTGAIPISSDARHRLTATAMGFVGHRSSNSQSNRFDNAWVGGPDVSVGYAYDFSERVTFDVRYRAIYFFALSGRDNLKDPKTTHGPSMSLAYRF